MAMNIVGDAEVLANMGGALLADGLQAGTARDTREMVKTVTSQYGGYWVWDKSKDKIAKALNMKFKDKGFDATETAIQTVVQGVVASMACMIVGMPRTPMRSMIDAMGGSVSQAMVKDKIGGQ
jgi:hypothetical protein